jgi:hypothetical protein
MKFKVEMSTDNAAFDGDAGAEVARILREVAGEVAGGKTDGKCRDINGNSVGKWSLTGETHA